MLHQGGGPLLNSPLACWVLVVEGLVDNAHYGNPCGPEVNPNQDQSTLQTRWTQTPLLHHFLTTLNVLAGGIFRQNHIQITKRVKFTGMWHSVCAMQISHCYRLELEFCPLSKRRTLRVVIVTDGVYPDAQVSGAEGHAEALCAHVCEFWVLVDGPCKEGSRCTIAVQHCG